MRQIIWVLCLSLLLVQGLTVPLHSSGEGQCSVDLYQYDEMAFHIAQFLGQQMKDTPLFERIEIGQWILDKSYENNLDPLLVLAVMQVESTFDDCAYSKYGAKGLMQVMPRRILTKEQLSLYAFNHHIFYEPRWNISFGVDYLASLVERFGSLETALAAYNAGPTRISRVHEKDKPLRTRYVRKVMSRYVRLQKRFDQRT